MTLTQKEGHSAGERTTGSTEDGEWLWNGTVLEVVPTFKYLGVLFSSDLSWTHQITSKVYAAKHARSWVSSTDATISTPTAEVCFSYMCVFGPTPPGLRNTSMGSSLTARHTLT